MKQVYLLTIDDQAPPEIIPITISGSVDIAGETYGLISKFRKEPAATAAEVAAPATVPPPVETPAPTQGNSARGYALIELALRQAGSEGISGKLLAQRLREAGITAAIPLISAMSRMHRIRRSTEKPDNWLVV